MSSPTQKLNTPIANAEIEIKDWITGAEAESLEKEMTDGLDIKTDMVNRKINIGKIDYSEVAQKNTHKTIEIFVISINGATDDILNKVLELPEKDYSFILSEIDNRRGKKKREDEVGQ